MSIVSRKGNCLMYFYLYIYLFLAALGHHCCEWTFSSCSEWSLLFIWCALGSCLWWLLLLQSTSSRLVGFSTCCWAQLPWGMWNLSSWSRDRTHVPCIGRWIPNHWTTREVPKNGDFTRNHWFVLTRNTTSPHVTFTQKSQEQDKCIPFTETTIYLSNIDDFSKFVF